MAFKINSDISRIVLVILALFALIFFLNMYQKNKDVINTERFNNQSFNYGEDMPNLNNVNMQPNMMNDYNNSIANNLATNTLPNMPAPQQQVVSEGVYPSEKLELNEIYKPINSEDLSPNQLPSDCYPKDKLTADDLLPRDANSRWAQVNPAGQGDVRDQNFLNAGFLLGINTVGQSLKNANLQLRSEPPNPQDKVSPWNQSTIDPDLNRKPLEIGGCQ